MQLTLTTFLSLDGVMQGSGGPNEDPSAGFTQGGWMVPYADEAMGRFVTDWLAAADAFLLGRTTYEIMVAYWPQVAIQQASAACCGACGDGVLSGGFEAGWHPGVAVEQVAEGVEFADAPFGSGGQVGLDDGEVGESFDSAPASSGAALLDLDGADCPLGFVVGEDVQVGAGREAQDHVLEGQEPAGDPPGVLRGRGAPVSVRGQPGRGQRPVPGDQVVQDARAQGRRSRLAGVPGGVAGLDEQAGHPGCPVLLAGLEVVQVFQVPEQVRLMPISA